VAAGQEQMNILHSERATLLDALDRLQPHLSKLFNSVDGSGQAQDRMYDRMEDSEETPLPRTGLPPAPAGPTHGLARLGKYLLDQQERGTSSADVGREEASKQAHRDVHTALNFSVAGKQPGAASNRDSSLPTEVDEEDFDSQSSHSRAFEREVQAYTEPHQTYALETLPHSASVLAPADEPWLHGAHEAPAVEQPKAAQGFWQLRGADLCLAASAVVLAAALTWALWPHPKRTVASSNAPVAATPAEPKLSAFEELLVSMGLAEAPPPPAVYAGTPATRVWVDINSALYYCPGAEPYGKTPKGKFLTQREAQDEQFQPARGQPCD
jgi:hypothetical protein